MRKFKKSISVICLFLILIVCSFLLFPGSYFYFFTINKRISKDKTPSLYLVPKITKEIETFSYNNIKQYDEIDTGPISIFLKNTRNYEILKIRNGKLTAIRNPKWGIIVENDPLDMLAAFQKDDSFESEYYDDVFGKGTFSSSYAFALTVLKTTPEDVSFISPLKTILRTSVLLLCKTVPKNISRIYFINVGNAKGFQFGDPSHGDKRTYVHLYPDTSRYYQIVFRGLDQNEINSILGTIKYNK